MNKKILKTTVMVIFLSFFTYTTYLYITFTTLHNQRVKNIQGKKIPPYEARNLLARIFRDYTGYSMVYLKAKFTESPETSKEKEYHAKAATRNDNFEIIETLVGKGDPKLSVYAPKALVYKLKEKKGQGNMPTIDTSDSFNSPYLDNGYFAPIIIWIFRIYITENHHDLKKFKSFVNKKAEQYTCERFSPKESNSRYDSYKKRYHLCFSLLIILLSIIPVLSRIWYPFGIGIWFYCIAFVGWSILFGYYNYHFKIHSTQPSWDALGTEKLEKYFYEKVGKKVAFQFSENKEQFRFRKDELNDITVIFVRYFDTYSQLGILVSGELKNKTVSYSSIIEYNPKTAFHNEYFSTEKALQIHATLCLIDAIEKEKNNLTFNECKHIHEFSKRLQNQSYEKSDFMTEIQEALKYCDYLLYFLLMIVLLSCFYKISISHIGAKVKLRLVNFNSLSPEKRQIFINENPEYLEERRKVKEFIRQKEEERQKKEKRREFVQRLEEKNEQKKIRNEERRKEKAAAEEQNLIEEEERRKEEEKAAYEDRRQRQETLQRIIKTIKHTDEEIDRKIHSEEVLKEEELFLLESMFIPLYNKQLEKSEAKEALPALVEEAEKVFSELPVPEQRPFTKKLKKYREAYQKNNNPLKVKKNLEWLIEKMSSVK